MCAESRRNFLRKGGLGLAAAATLGSGRSVQGANDRVVLGIIGCGGRGRRLGEELSSLGDVRVSHVCDPDQQRVDQALEVTGADHGVSDLRRILEDASVDAVVIAACDHWHAPAAILACEAGKHVYVEKPCGHNLREGRQMLEAARRHRRVMQHGTQSRSSPSIKKGIQMLHEGLIGKVLIAKSVNSQRRVNIGRQQPSKPPSHLDYDLWVGPAEWAGYQSNFVHYHWHWFEKFGTGDIGNDGVHGIDLARWGLGVETHPSFVAGYGSKMFFDDDQEFPDTYSITYEYPGDNRVGSKRVLIYEQRDWSPYRQDAEENSLFFYGTEGMMTMGSRGIRIFGKDNEPIRRDEYGATNADHLRDFLDAIQSGGRRTNADIEIGHLSAALPHLGNIVARTGRSIRFDPVTEQIDGDDEANRLLGRRYRENHWAIPSAV